jgi:probable F420-dependent oxidoreductase
MKFGVAIFPTDQTIQPVPLAKEVEARGFESLWFPEHSHIPVSRTTPWGGRVGAPPLPDFYWRSHHQFIALAAAAAVTTNLKLASGITLVAQRDPIWLAKELASLDMISDGRVLVGIGYGWNVEELAHHGVKYTDRRAVVRERVLAMKELWTNDVAEFHGEHVDFEPSWSWPKPVQPGGPPVILGGAAGPKTMADIVEFCDGWMPIGGRHDLVGSIDALHQTAVDAGRDPASIELGLFYGPTDPAKIEALAAVGVSRIVFGLPQGPADEVLAALDDLAPLVGSI